MSENPQFRDAVMEILRTERRYAAEAYFFMEQAVVFSAAHFRKPDAGPGRHLSVTELIDGIRQHALAEYGPLAFSVLRDWGIHQTLDFGQIVFILIKAEVFAAQPSDRLEDFSHGFDFTDAFLAPYQVPLELPQARQLD